jgi:hypothetical protein
MRPRLTTNRVVVFFARPAQLRIFALEYLPYLQISFLAAKNND